MFRSDITCVYVIGRRGGPCKVGMSADPIKRLASIQTGCAMEVEIWGYCTFPSRLVAKSFEKAAHQSLARKRMFGEWFAVEPEDAIQAIEGVPGYYEIFVREDS
jgi:hypothetical protein